MLPTGLITLWYLTPNTASKTTIDREILDVDFFSSQPNNDEKYEHKNFSIEQKELQIHLIPSCAKGEMAQLHHDLLPKQSLK